MQYSSLVVAAAALVGFVGAQNSSETLPAGISACCTVAASTIPSATKDSWCLANQNTCPELCGGQGNVANGGNECNSTSLAWTCQCSNGTKPDMAEYQQTVDGLMCRYWFSGCINATNQDAGLQYTCTSIRDQECGNKTTDSAVASSSSSSALPSRTSAAASSGASSASSSTASAGSAAALDMVREYSTPILAGGIAAVFGLVL